MTQLEKNSLFKLNKYISDDIKKKIIITTNTPLTLFDLINYIDSYKKEYLLLSHIQNISDKQYIYSAILQQLNNYNNNKKQLGGGNNLVDLLNLIVFSKQLKDLTYFKNIPSDLLTNNNIPKMIDENRKKITELGFEIDNSQLYRKRTKQKDYGYLLKLIRKYCVENNLNLISKNKPINNIIKRVYTIELKE